MLRPNSWEDTLRTAEEPGEAMTFKSYHPASKAYVKEKNSWETLCLAESRDGIHWTRPELDIVEFRGSKQNNLILDAAMVREIGGSPAHTAVFKDTNPDCPDGQRYKCATTTEAGRSR